MGALREPRWQRNLSIKATRTGKFTYEHTTELARSDQLECQVQWRHIEPLLAAVGTDSTALATLFRYLLPSGLGGLRSPGKPGGALLTALPVLPAHDRREHDPTELRANGSRTSEWTERGKCSTVAASVATLLRVGRQVAAATRIAWRRGRCRTIDDLPRRDLIVEVANSVPTGANEHARAPEGSIAVHPDAVARCHANARRRVVAVPQVLGHARAKLADSSPLVGVAIKRGHDWPWPSKSTLGIPEAALEGDTLTIVIVRARRDDPVCT